MGGAVCPGWAGSERGPAPAPPAPALVRCSWADLASSRGAAGGLQTSLGADLPHRALTPLWQMFPLGTRRGYPWSPLFGLPAGDQVLL